MCYANNSIGLVKKTYQTKVHYPPEVNEVEHKETSLEVNLHHGLNLECKVQGSPEPKLSWFFVSPKIFDSTFLA